MSIVCLLYSYCNLHIIFKNIKQSLTKVKRLAYRRYKIEIISYSFPSNIAIKSKFKFDLIIKYTFY